MVWVKCQINQIAALIKVSILKAANRESFCSVVVGHDGFGAVEVEGAQKGTTNRTAPISAVEPDTDWRTIAVFAVARRGQLER